MQQQSVQQLDAAVSEVFALMLNRECNPGHCPAPPQCGQRESANTWIVALISFSGSMRGSCSVHLTLHTAAAITSDLLGEDGGQTPALTQDAAGELCNMIAGSWKSRQSFGNASCAISQPLVTVEDTLQTAQTTLNLDQPASTDTHLERFRHTLIRVYRFEEHCLRLCLSFD